MRLDQVFTSRHGSWLNRIETVLSLFYSGHRQMSVDIDIHYTSAGGFAGFDQGIISLHNFSL